MSRCPGWFAALAMLVVGLATASLAGTRYLITNNDTSSLINSASIFSVDGDGSLTHVRTIQLQGSYSGVSFSGANLLNIQRSQTSDCVYFGGTFVKDGYLTGVESIDFSTQTHADAVPGFELDNPSQGVPLAATPNGKYLFADFPGSNNIMTYELLPGCKLKRLSEIITGGARTTPQSFVFSDAARVMKVTPNGKFLILTYGDGSFASYAINPNTGALRLVSRYLVADGGFAEGIDITSDSRWVVFGDTAKTLTGPAAVEVAAIHENGSLGPTHAYTNIGRGFSSSSVWLSPDETILYIANDFSGQITAAPFNRMTGVVNAGEACTSPHFPAVSGSVYFLTGLTGSSDTPSGSPLYATFASSPGAIGIMNFHKPCKFTVSPSSPAIVPQSSLYGVGMDPPRNF
jgi:6-phosphogluconolactonase (cycloisomerase 2 family)